MRWRLAGRVRASGGGCWCSELESLVSGAGGAAGLEARVLPLGAVAKVREQRADRRRRYDMNASGAQSGA